MPDLGNLSLSSSSSCTLSSCSSLKPFLPPPPPDDVTPSEAVNPSIDGRDSVSENGEACNANDGTIRVLKRSRKGGILEDWGDKKMDLSTAASTSRCYLPFLVRGAKKMAECLDCQRFINPGEGISCSVRNCQRIFHAKCVKQRLGVSNPIKFKFTQHVCCICKQRFQLQCLRCDIAFHDKCAPWPNEVIHLTNQPGRVICWRHPSNWQLDKKAELTGLMFLE